MNKIYLACPYSHPDPAMRRWRVHQANMKAAELMEQGNLVFSPLSHSHPISEHCEVDPTDHDFWLRQDLWILDICDEMYILCLPGWVDSKGIDTEIKYAESKGIKVTLDGGQRQEAEKEDTQAEGGRLTKDA